MSLSCFQWEDGGGSVSQLSSYSRGRCSRTWWAWETTGSESERRQCQHLWCTNSNCRSSWLLGHCAAVDWCADTEAATEDTVDSWATKVVAVVAEDGARQDPCNGKLSCSLGFRFLSVVHDLLPTRGENRGLWATGVFCSTCSWRRPWIPGEILKDSLNMHVLNRSVHVLCPSYSACYWHILCVFILSKLSEFLEVLRSSSCLDWFYHHVEGFIE